jgi:hypothetical protein
MAKRKPARRATTSRAAASSRKRTTTRSGGTSARRATARTTRSSTAPKAGRRAKTGGAPRKRTAKAASTRPKSASASRKRPAATPKQPPTAGRKGAARAGRGTSARKAPRSASKPAAPKTLQRRDSSARRRQIENDRRLIEETLPMPPSSLDLDRHPSAARSGRAEMAEAFADHNAASPGITAGDVDADWESAYSTGDEAPGGDMPTPDQDVVEEIGTALGVQYADDEELKGADKIEQRDKHRWELDPASAEDYQDRSRQK